MRTHMMLAVLSFPIWPICLALNKVYLARAVERQTEEIRRIINASLMGVGFIVAAAFVAQFHALSRLWVLSVLAFVPLCLVVERTVARRIFARLRREGRILRRVLVVGTDAEAIGLVHATQRHPELGYQVVGFVGPDDIGTRGGCEVLGGFEDTQAVLEESGRQRRDDLAGVRRARPRRTGSPASSPTPATTWRCRPGSATSTSCASAPRTSAGTPSSTSSRRSATAGGPSPSGSSTSHCRSSRSCSPPRSSLVAAIAIRLESKGGVIFAQERVGRDGRRFRMLKLRTMVVDAEERKAELAEQNEADGPMFKIADDPRITRVGRILRKLSIDEIPQFVNVLRGEMSVVGPRPALPAEVEQWTEDVHDRLRVLPGITGMWQVSGRSDTTFDEYKRLDLYYVDNWSLAHDLRIVARTFRVVVASRGAR